MMKVDEEEFVLRPMNCPHHMLIYGNKLHSYRDLPIRIGEFATDFRYEASGAVKGLERVRCMCQNDAHLFVRPDQIGEEFQKVVRLILDVYEDFGIKNYKIASSNHVWNYVYIENNWYHLDLTWDEKNTLMMIRCGMKLKLN